MENLTADVIVEAYTKYQLFNFWKNCGFTVGPISLMVGFILVLICCFNNKYIGGIIIANVFGILAIIGFTIGITNAYKIEIVLKPEIAKYVVSAGFDLADKVGKEVYEIWDLLKELLKK